MKRRNSITKRILAFALLVAFLLSSVPGNMTLVFAQNSTEEGYITDVTGLTDWDKVWLKESVTLTEDVTVTGEVKMEPGVSVSVAAGRFTVETQAVVNGDITIEKSGIADIAGTVNGTVYVNSTDSDVHTEDWDGSMVRARNFVAQQSSVIDTIILNGAGNGYIDGKVNTLKVDKNYSGDYGAEWNSVVQSFEYCGMADFYNCGHMYEARVTGGVNFSNNPGATIDRIKVSDGLFNNNGTVHMAIVEKSGRISNNNNQDTDYEESRIEYVVVKENAELIPAKEEESGMEYYRNLENYGNITSLIAYGGEICTLGDVDYLYADGCRTLFIDTAGSWWMDRGTDYQVEYLYAKDTEVFFQDWSDERTKMPKIRTARLENGTIYAIDILVEELYLSGSFSGLYLERAEIYDLYIADLELTEQTYVEVPTPEEVVIADFKASPEAQDVYEMVTAGMYERLNEEEQALIKEFVFETEELAVDRQEITEKEFTKTLEQYDILTVDFSVTSAVGAVLVESPSGYEFMVMSKDDSVCASFMAYESGEYKFRVLGDEYGAKLSMQVTKAAKLNLEVFTQYATENPEEAEKEKASLKEFSISVYDRTEGKEFTGFITEGEQLLFQENPKGHTYAITLSSLTMPWEFEPETVEITIGEGETKEAEVVVKQYGDYFGYTVDGTVPQVYFYDENGNFVRSAGTDAYGNFWAGRLPSGKYTAILLRDDTGNYMFSHIDSFAEYGFVEKEDYLKDSFTLEAGLNISYPEVTLPDAPVVENLYFDTNLTSVNTNRQTTVAGELVQVTLNYAFCEEYTDKISGLLFTFKLSDFVNFIKGSVTVNGNAVSDYALEDGCLIVPAEGASGSICYQISSEQTDVTLQNTATAEFIAGGKEVKQLIGIASTYITALTATFPTATGTGKISVTGYTSPYETVSVLDNGEVIAEIQSGSSGYYSAMVDLPENVSRHKVCVARQFGTANEIRTEEQIVSVMSTAPELLEFSMYYYVHGHSAKFHFTGEEFSTKRFTYDYWPGSVFTFEMKMDDSSRIDEMYVVSNKGSVKKLQAFYDEEKDLWVASGIFSEDENYAPADFDIEMTMKTVSIEELGDYDMAEDEVKEELLDLVYEKAEKEVVNTNYDEAANTIYATVNVTSEEMELDYSADVTMSYHKAERTSEELLEQGYLCENVDGIDVFYKHELDMETGKIVMTTVLFLTEAQETAMGDDLVLFGTIADSISNFRGELEQIVEVNTEDVLYDYIRKSLGEDTQLPQALVDYLDEQDYAHKPLEGVYDFLDKLEEIGEEVDDWTDTLTGKEANEERQKYFDKLAELERQLDQMQQAQMNGEAKECGMIPLDSFYDDLAACYASANNIANSKWSLGMISKICSSAAGFAVSKGSFKYKGEDVDLADLLEIPTIEETGFDFIDNSDVVTNINNTIERVNEYLDVENLYEKGIDWLAGDTLDYWDNANAAHIAQLEKNINELLMGSANQVDAGGGSGGGNGCFPPSVPKPKVTVPGGGGDVNWDPSGYIYEGVPSNRLAGVTATTYYRGEDGSEILWNAEEYGQINPQVTDSQGCYGWFVPEGEWKVVYTKDGYEIAETEWLPVPPPQTEVNIGLVSAETPELDYVVVSPAGAVISFSKYVTTESVQDSTIVVKDAAGAVLSGTLEAVNAEEDATGRTLASKFRVVFTNQAVVGSTYTVSVKSGIVGYNGKAVSATEQSVVCAIQPEGISVQLPDYVLTGAESTILVTITADGGFDAMTLECVSDTEFLEVVSIGKISGEGTAELVVKGIKAGVSRLELSITGSDVTVTQDIVTCSENDAGLMKYVEKQKAQAAGDTTVEEASAGSSIILWITFVALSVTVVYIIGFFVQKNIKKQRRL